MNDATFYNALKKCFVRNRNCLQCPLYAQGLSEDNRCLVALEKEINDRKKEAYRKEEEES